MRNSLANNMVDFLLNYEPFKSVDYIDLQEIAGQSEIIYLQKNDILFEINNSLHKFFYIVNSGVIHLTKNIDAEDVLITKCYKGSIFGLRPFFAKNNYSLSSVANEDTIIFALPIVLFKPILAKYSDVIDYFLEIFSNQTKTTGENYQTLKAINDIQTHTESTDYSYFQELEYDKNPLLLPMNTSILKIAQEMTEHNKTYALITNNSRLTGIVTDTDFRKKIAFGLDNFKNDATKIMNTHFETVEDTISVAGAQLLLLKNESSILCITEDGTENSKIKGVITERDIIKSQSNNPGVLLDEIKKTKDFEELNYIHTKYRFVIQNSVTKNLPIFHINNTASEILFSLLNKIVLLAIEKTGIPPTQFSFLALGSQGRKEQLLVTNQNNILVFEDVAPEKYREVKFYFVQLAKLINAEIDKLGYYSNENEIIASNLKWTKSYTETISLYNSWIKTPGEKNNDYDGIFFDFELIYGDQKIKDNLEIAVFQSLKNNTIFFDFAGNLLLKNPYPLTFFKKFSVDEDGNFKDMFNLKQKGIQFYVDFTRLIALSFGLKGINNTFLRLKQLALLDKKHSELYTDLADNYIKLVEFRTKEGVMNDNNGAYIKVDELTKPEKEELKKCLQSIDDMVDLIKDKFKLTRFS